MLISKMLIKPKGLIPSSLATLYFNPSLSQKAWITLKSVISGENLETFPSFWLKVSLILVQSHSQGATKQHNLQTTGPEHIAGGCFVYCSVDLSVVQNGSIK